MNFSSISVSVGHGVLLAQIFDLLGGGFLIMLGGMLSFTVASWRVRALQLNGETLGVRRRGPYYHGVYRYALPTGEVRQATSVQGHSSPQGFETGRQVAIQVMADKPDEAREQHAPMLWGLSAALLLSGAWLVYLALTGWQHSPLTWIFIVVVAALIAYWLQRRVRRVLAKIQPVAPTPPCSTYPIEPVGLTALAPPQAPHVVTRSKSRRAGLTFVAVGTAIFATTLYLAHQLVQLRTGVRSPGTVIELSFRNSSPKGSDPNQFPVVRFTSADGVVRTFYDRTGQNPSPYHVGEQVTVVYPQNEPTEAMIDRGAGNWEPVVMLGLLGTVFTGVGLFSLRRP